MCFIVHRARDGRKPGARGFLVTNLIAGRLTDHSTLLGNLVTHSRDFH